MCLSNILINTVEESDGYHGIGYKAFQDSDSGVLRDFNLGKLRFAPRVWYQSPSIEPLYSNNGPIEYSVGYHIFPNLEDLKKYMLDSKLWANLPLFKVKYKDILAVGHQYIYSTNDYKLCLTSKWMYIMERVS